MVTKRPPIASLVGELNQGFAFDESYLRLIKFSLSLPLSTSTNKLTLKRLAKTERSQIQLKG